METTPQADQAHQELTPPPAPPAAGPEQQQQKLPLRARLNLWLRRARFRWAWRLVRGMDGIVMSDAAIKAATLELGKMPGWLDELFKGQTRKVEMVTSRIEQIMQFILLAGEIGDPALQTQALMQLYLQLRQMTMSRRQKERMGYEAALQRLPKRVNPRLCPHGRRVTPEGQYTKFKCLDCGHVGDVEKGATVGVPPTKGPSDAPAPVPAPLVN